MLWLREERQRYSLPVGLLAVEQLSVETLSVEPLSVEPLSVEQLSVETLSVEPLSTEPLRIEPHSIKSTVAPSINFGRYWRLNSLMQTKRAKILSFRAFSDPSSFRYCSISFT